LILGTAPGCHRIQLPTTSNRDTEEVASELDEARLQLTVLLETVEALQAGSPDEKDQAVVGMAAQLAAARAREGALERRAGDLLVRVPWSRQEPGWAPRS
jgi:hypothetical protein